MTEEPKILVIDDSEYVRERIRQLLDENGYTCLMAEDGDRGITAAREHNPALIILDMTMPRTNGMDVLRLLRKDNSLNNTPIMMLSKHGTPQDKMVSYALGANRFATKPIVSDALMEDIQYLLKRFGFKPNQHKKNNITLN